MSFRNKNYYKHRFQANEQEISLMKALKIKFEVS